MLCLPFFDLNSLARISHCDYLFLVFNFSSLNFLEMKNKNEFGKGEMVIKNKNEIRNA